MKWTIPVAVVLVPAYLLGVRLVTVWIEQGGPGWLHLIALTLAWSAIKFTLMIPVSLALLAKARINERRARNQWGRGIGGYEPGHSAGAWTTLP